MKSFRITFYSGASIRIEVLVTADTVDQAKIRALEKVMMLVEEWKDHNVYVPYSFTEVGFTKVMG